MIEDLKCPNCGGFVSREQRQCDFCGGSIFLNSARNLPNGNLELQKYLKFYSQISTGESDEIDFSRGVIFLKLKQYKNAINTFEKLVSTNMLYSNLYFYISIALLEGKKAFQVKKDTIDRVIVHLETAISIENKGIYRIFLAYIKYDYYKRKFINISPNYKQELVLAQESGYSSEDFDELWELLNVSKPKEF